MPPIPFPENDLDLLFKQTELILRSYHRWLGRDLIASMDHSYEQARALFEAPMVVAASDNAQEPRLIYGNRKALELWQLTWDEFTRMPARQTAEPVEQAARDQFLNEVRKNGFISDYSGIRISSTGRRFWIKQATVWNLTGEKDEYLGQAVLFNQYDYL